MSEWETSNYGQKKTELKVEIPEKECNHKYVYQGVSGQAFIYKCYECEDTILSQDSQVQ